MNLPFIQEYARRALDYTAHLIDQFGGRLAGSESCRLAANRLCDDLAQICGSADIESFQTHPDTFGRFYRIDAVIYLVCVVLLWLNQPLPAVPLLAFMIIGAGLQFGYYIELYDRFYPLKTGYNVMATLEPQETPVRQVILSGHHDSAQELAFLKGNQKLYGLKILIPDSFRMLALVFSIYWLAHLSLYGMAPAITLSMKILLTIGIYFVFTKFFLFGSRVTPGAGDNLIACAMLLEAARHFADPRQPGHSVLKDSRLMLVSFDAEESGLRGSRAFVRAHRDQLMALPTQALNIDSIYTAADLQFLTSDLNDHVKLDQALAKECVQISHKAGIPARLVHMSFGGGGTDAAELIRAGVRATTMIAMKSSLVRDGLVYHTMQDTVDAIEPDAVEACLRVAIDWINKCDEDCVDYSDE